MDEIVNMQRCRFSRVMHNKGILECNFVRKQIHICFTRFLFLGIFFVLPCIETYQKVDLRTITLDVPPQEVIINQTTNHIFSQLETHSIFQVLTRDSVTVSVDAVVYYRVSNATISVANVENAHHSTRLLAQTTLRNILGTKHLHEILSERDSISSSMQVEKKNEKIKETN